MVLTFTYIVAAFMLGYLIVPETTKELLTYKYEEINSKWLQDLHAYARHIDFVGRKPGFDGERVEKGMAEWGARQIVLVNGGKLSYEKVRALRDVGVIPPPAQSRDPTKSLPHEQEIAVSYRLCVTMRMRLLCGIALALVAAILAMGNAGAIGCIAGVVAGAAMESTFLTDMRARIIPWQTTLVFGVCAALFALDLHWLEGLAASLITALALYLLLNLTNAAMQFVSGSPAIGGGDLRFIPMICIFSGLAGSIWGFIGASVVMALIALVTVLFKHGNRKSYVPYAPGLSCWFAIGLVVQVLTL